MRVALIGNYPPDRQQSMLRYADMLRAGLAEAGHDVVLALPRPVLRGRVSLGQALDNKWVAYLDKYILGLESIRTAVAAADVVHVCDHSNAVYVPAGRTRPYVVTCHDLLAVRGALGEDTDCPASPTGRLLQRRILAGLRRADAVACVSEATLRDARRLLNGFDGELAVVPNPLSHPYRRLDSAATRARLAGIPPMRDITRYVLHVGSNLRRKNRALVLRALARAAPSWDGVAVFAGEPLDTALRAMAKALGIVDRVIDVPGPDNDQLEALYNGALALVFPSRFEGFGWPVVEAQACGCPVICSDREPLPEVTGGAAIHLDADDAEGFGQAIIALDREPRRREDLARRGLVNAARYGRSEMVGRFVALYDRLLRQS